MYTYMFICILLKYCYYDSKYYILIVTTIYYNITDENDNDNSNDNANIDNTVYTTSTPVRRADKRDKTWPEAGRFAPPTKGGDRFPLPKDGDRFPSTPCKPVLEVPRQRSIHTDVDTGTDPAATEVGRKSGGLSGR